MRGLIVALLAIAPIAVFAQHQGHTMPMPKKPAVKKPAVKKQTAKEQPVKKQTTKKKSTTKKKAPIKRKTTTKRSSTTAKKPATMPPGHVMPPKKPGGTPAKQDPMPPGHVMPPKKPGGAPAKQDPMPPGHVMPPTKPGGDPAKQDPMPPGHVMPGTQPTQQGQNPTFPPPEPFPQYDKRGWPNPVMDEMKFSFTLFERLEYLPSGGGGELAWDVIRWHGGDYRRIWFKSEGEQSFVGEGEGKGDIEIHMGRLVKPFVDFLTGIRVDGVWGDRTLGRVSVGAGFQAVQPYVVESEAFVFLSQFGQIYFNGTFSRDFYITQRLVLQPRAETNLAVNSDRRFGSGAGLQDLDLSLRLRYEVRREFAPYIGISGRWLFGETASMARTRGEEASRYRFLIGLRTWF